MGGTELLGEFELVVEHVDGNDGAGAAHPRPGDYIQSDTAGADDRNQISRLYFCRVLCRPEAGDGGAADAGRFSHIYLIIHHRQLILVNQGLGSKAANPQRLGNRTPIRELETRRLPRLAHTFFLVTAGMRFSSHTLIAMTANLLQCGHHAISRFNPHDLRADGFYRTGDFVA